MATKHVCDRCGAEVKSRSDFWEVRLQRVEQAHMVGGAALGYRESKFERWELCERCKKQIYVALHEPRGD